jgi:hypothetical protein
MAILTNEEINEMTNQLARRIKQEKDIANLTIEYSGDLAATFLQAIEDWLDSNKASAVSAIDTATSPIVLPNKIKKWAFALVVMNRCKGDLV